MTTSLERPRWSRGQAGGWAARWGMALAAAGRAGRAGGARGRAAGGGARRRSAPRGGEAHAIAADVADREATHAIAGQAAALVGPVDVLINNASTLGPVPLRLLLDTDCEDLERALAVNLVGPFRLTKAVPGRWCCAARGLIVNISSDAAIEAYPTLGRLRRVEGGAGSAGPHLGGRAGRHRRARADRRSRAR